MQLAIGKRWVLDLQFSVALRKRVEQACGSVRTSVRTTTARAGQEMRWERDKLAGQMLSGWFDQLNKP